MRARACDAGDGVTDGVLEDPRQCRFDPGTLLCATNQKPDTCLSAAQVEAARRVYRGPVDPTSRATIYPGMAFGSEPFWPNRDPSNPFPIPVSHYKWLVFGDPNWDWKTFDMSKPSDYQAYQKAEAKFAPILNATNPDLREFRKRGGKLLQWHGWSDQLIAAQNSIDYYESVLSQFGGNTGDVQTFYRLFMAPGVTHCSGGPGPNTFDMQAVLEEWVEKGKAPDQIIATRNPDHPQLMIRAAGSTAMRAPAFGFGPALSGKPAGFHADLLFRAGLDEYNGTTRVKWEIKDILPLQ